METVLDLENTVTFIPVKEKEILKVGSPYHPNNKLVAVGYTYVKMGHTPTSYTFHHNQADPTPDGFSHIQDVLNNTTLLIGHNLKHDLAWLRECGFTYNGKCWDTMLAAYIFSCGRKEGTSLEECVKKAGINGHKGELMSNYLDEGINVDDMPYKELIEYLDNDVDITMQLYLHQRKFLENSGTNKPHFEKALNLVNSFLPYLVDMERAGIYVDQSKLQVIKAEYEVELNQVHNDITQMVRELMGDRPYNLNSPDDLCAIVYSRRPRDKRQWAIDFNIGSELRNGVSKPKRLTVYKKEAFLQKLRTSTIIERKTKANQCSTCKGKGTTYKLTKAGKPYKKMPMCKTCEGTGIEYLKLNEIAGLALPPQNKYASSAGFACNADVVEELLELRIPDKARKFLGLVSRRNRLEVWVNTFCFQLQKYSINGIIHPSFNQHITATGRLSCTAPNMQNQPKRDKTFKLRKAFISRWKGGRLYEADFGQLEFRIAALLANCQAAIDFITAGNDIHCVTRDFYYGDLEIKPKHPWPKGNPKEDRQTAKAETFGPLYGKDTEWTEMFYHKFPGIAAWHDRLMAEAATTKQTISPSGRIYSFPYAERYVNYKGKLMTSGQTQIKNYSVQGFATGDLVLLVLMDIMQYLQEHNAKSKLCIQVHDSALVDVHPDEFELVEQAFNFAFGNIYKKAKEFFGIDINVPLAFDLEYGVNWYGDKE
jgi:DNA polymerase I-like protein with 3'-5' exonuclease and polymerase domains